MSTAQSESLLRLMALRRVLSACRQGRYPADPALIACLERVADRAALWASVASEHEGVA